MAQNKILPWAQTGTANVLSDADYAADVATGGLYGDGVKTGQASSQQANKTWRQATAPGSGLGQFLVDNLGVDVTDADTPSTFSTRIANAVLKLAQISPFNQSWAVATGGYRKYAIVSDSSGNFWVSTADQNTTVPGSSGANWQSLFDGYATQAWSDGRYIRSPANPNTDARILTISRNKASGGIFAAADDGSNTQLQPAGDYATNTTVNGKVSKNTSQGPSVDSMGIVSRSGQPYCVDTSGVLRYIVKSPGTTPTDIPIQSIGISNQRVYVSYQNDTRAVWLVRSPAEGSTDVIVGAIGINGSSPYFAYGGNNNASNPMWLATQEFARGSFSFQAAGYQIFPSGLIIQWGQNTTGAGTYSFPTTFPNGCFAVVSGNTDAQGDYVDNVFAYAVNNSQFYIGTKSSSTGMVTGFHASWFALGY